MSASTTTTSSSPHKMLGSMIKNAFRVIYYINTGCMPSGRKGECITIDDFAYSLMWPIIPVFGALLCIVLAFLLVTFGFYWLSCRASRRDMLNWRWTRTLVKTSTKALVLTYGLLFPYCTHMSYVIGRVPKTPGKDDRALSLLLIMARVQVAWCTFAIYRCLLPASWKSASIRDIALAAVCNVVVEYCFMLVLRKYADSWQDLAISDAMENGGTCAIG